MEKEIIQQLLKNNTILAETTHRLAASNQEAFSIIQEQLADNEETRDYFQQEYQTLKKKKQRNAREEYQYHYLRKKLLGK